MIIFCWFCAYLTPTVPWNCGTLFYHKKITLNILFPSLPHKKIFDQFHIAWQFDCETNPIGYPGTIVVENIKPTDCLYWLTHGDL